MAQVANYMDQDTGGILPLSGRARAALPVRHRRGRLFCFYHKAGQGSRNGLMVGAVHRELGVLNRGRQAQKGDTAMEGLRVSCAKTRQVISCCRCCFALLLVMHADDVLPATIAPVSPTPAPVDDCDVEAGTKTSMTRCCRCRGRLMWKTKYWSMCTDEPHK